MSWIFGKKKKAAGSTDVEPTPGAKPKKKGNDDFLLGAESEDIDYMSSGMHKEGDERQFASELAELGFAVEEEQPRGARGLRAAAPPADPSMYHVPEISEEDMQLTEEDMNDPELLAAFVAIGSSDDAPACEHDLIDMSPLEAEKTSIPDMEGMDIDHLQVLALSLTNEGRREEALEVMKRIRYLKYADKIQDSVDSAKDISASRPTTSSGPVGSSPLNEEVPPRCAPYGFPGDAKQFALRLKQGGFQAEAIQWLRYAKQIEAGGSILPRVEVLPAPPPAAAAPAPAAAAAAAAPVATAREERVSAQRAPPPRPPSTAGKQAPGDIFAPLESALEEAISFHFRKASAAKKDLTALTGAEDGKEDPAKAKSPAYVAQRAKFRTMAADQMRLYKQYTQELAVLHSRRATPGAAPPLFRWEAVQISTPVENTYLGDEQIELAVNGVRDMEVLLSGHSHRAISISYNMGIPRDNPVTGDTPTVKYVDGEGCTWDFKIVLPFKRAKSLHSLLERKKVLFEIILHRGMFYGGDVTLGMVSLPLAELLTKTTAGGDSLPVTKEGRGRGIGGVLSAYARLRTPVDGPEVRVVEERVLVVSPWPDVVHPPPVSGAAADAAPADASAVTDVKSSAQMTDDESPTPGPEPVIDPPQPVDTAVAAGANDKIAKQLTEKELNDPFSADLLLSNDVMDAELESLKEQLAQCSDPDEQFNLNFRYELIERNLNILIMRVQNESLSLEAYLDMVRDRLKRDQLLALHFKNSGDTGVALKLMKRIKVMTEEIKNAES